MKKQDDEFIDRTTSHLVPLVGESVLYDIIVKDGAFTQENAHETPRSMHNTYTTSPNAIMSHK